jgi:hypothetical protein
MNAIQNDLSRSIDGDNQAVSSNKNKFITSFTKNHLCKQMSDQLDPDDVNNHTFERELFILKSETPQHNHGKKIKEACWFASVPRIASSIAHNEEERFLPPRPKRKRFIDLFPSFSNIFSHFVAYVRSKSDKLDLIKCLQI